MQEFRSFNEEDHADRYKFDFRLIYQTVNYLYDMVIPAIEEQKVMLHFFLYHQKNKKQHHINDRTYKKFKDSRLYSQALWVVEKVTLFETK